MSRQTTWEEYRANQQPAAAAQGGHAATHPQAPTRVRTPQQRLPQRGPPAAAAASPLGAGGGAASSSSAGGGRADGKRDDGVVGGEGEGAAGAAVDYSSALPPLVTSDIPAFAPRQSRVDAGPALSPASRATEATPPPPSLRQQRVQIVLDAMEPPSPVALVYESDPEDGDYGASPRRGRGRGRGGSGGGGRGPTRGGAIAGAGRGGRARAAAGGGATPRSRGGRSRARSTRAVGRRGGRGRDGRGGRSGGSDSGPDADNSNDVDYSETHQLNKMKRRGRKPKKPSPSPEEILARAAPSFFPFVCEWAGCRGPAELLNLETLRRHVLVVHGGEEERAWEEGERGRAEAEGARSRVGWEGDEMDVDLTVEGSVGVEGMRKEGEHRKGLACRWARCGRSSSPPRFDTMVQFQEHLEAAHLIPFSWFMGDGLKHSVDGQRENDKDAQKLPRWLLDKDGNQVTPSTKDQKVEDAATAKMRRRKLKRLLKKNMPVKVEMDSPTEC